MISLIAAIDKNNGIGKDNNLLTYIREDLQYFKKVTDGHTIIMGYNTWLSLPKKPLPNRKNIILTNKKIEIDGVIVINSIETILDINKINHDDEIFIIGGASMYNQMIKYADKLYITHIFENFDADVFFPKINSEWEITKIVANKTNINHEHPHIFSIYEKI